MSEEESKTAPGAREEGGEADQPEGTEGGAGAPDEGTGPGHSTPTIGTQDQGGEQTGVAPGGGAHPEEDTKPKE